MDDQGPHIVVAGAGFVGLHAAYQLQRRARRWRPRITVVNPDNFMLFQPLLPEVASGGLEPRHAVVPLRRMLKDCELLIGRVTGADTGARRVRVAPTAGSPYEMDYDHLVLGLGAIPRVFPVPGVEEHGVGFSSISEALHLRNAILSRLEVAETTPDQALRERALSVVFVGGGYTGVEALAELHHMATEACKYFRNVKPSDLRWTLVEATDSILLNLPESLGQAGLEHLRAIGVEVRLETQVEKVEEGVLTLSDGDRLPADTLVWSTGVMPDPTVTELDVPTDDMGRVVVDRYLRVRDRDGVWAAGDCAAVPDPRGGTYPPTAQHAVREGRRIADNIVRRLRRQPPQAFHHSTIGELVTLGRFSGVGHVRGRPITGPPVWALRRVYYAAQMPTAQRRLRLGLDWLTSLAFPPDVVNLGGVERPGEPLRRAFETQARESSSGG